jgi:DNA-binding transcriptional LysR family regulator
MRYASSAANPSSCSHDRVHPSRSTSSKLFHTAGFHPTISHTAADIPTMLGLVSSGMGCCIAPESFSKHIPDIGVFPLDDPQTSFDLEVVWRSGNDSVLLKRFLQAARSVVSADAQATA